MRVLLTGGAGFIGTHVRAALLAHGHDVVVLDSLRPDVHRGARPQIDGLIVGDVRDPDACARALDGVDAVCHLAAKVGIGVDVFDSADYADSNVHGTAVLLQELARAGVTRLVQASSMVVYGDGLGSCIKHGSVAPAARTTDAMQDGDFEPPCPVCGRPLAPAVVTESAPLAPRNTYAASKVGQEQFAACWARETGGASMSLRFHNVYGPGLPADTPYAGVAALFLDALRRGEAPRVFEDGRQRRDFIHVRDIAAATVAAVEQPRPGASVLNVGSGTVRTVGDMAAALADALDGPRPVVTGQFRVGDVRHITADSTAAREQLGWQPTEEFQAGMAELATPA